MKNVLQQKGTDYDHMINAIGDEQRWNAFNFDQKDEDIIEKCLQENLSTVSSYEIPKKTGFFEGVGDHNVKGKAKVILLGQDEYLRLEKFEISYNPITEYGYKIPELYVYLNKGDNLNSEYKDLGNLKTNLGGKNYKLEPELEDRDLDEYDTVIIYDIIHKEVFAKIELNDPNLFTDPFYDIIDEIKIVDSPKIESRIIHERYGFFEGVGGSEAKGSADAYFTEDEGILQIEKFEISVGREPELYLTKNEQISKNGHWTIGPDNNLYVVSGNTNEILRYDAFGKLINNEKFVTDKSNGLIHPSHLEIKNDKILVSSSFNDSINYYDERSGKSFDKNTISLRDTVLYNDNSVMGPNEEIMYLIILPAK